VDLRPSAPLLIFKSAPRGRGWDLRLPTSISKACDLASRVPLAVVLQRSDSDPRAIEEL